MSTILLAGATGFVGQALGEKLVRLGFRVRVVTRAAKSATGLAYPAEICVWEKAADGTLALPASAFDGVTAVVNLAGENVGEGRWTKQRKERILASRVEATAALVRGALTAAAPPAVFVQASAIGFYGDCAEAEVDESTAAGSGFLANVCRAWEASAQALHKTVVRHVTLRIGMVTGIDGGALAKMHGMYNAGLGGNLGGGAQWVGWVHVDDLLAMITTVIQNEHFEGTYNAVAPEPCRFRDLNQAILAERRQRLAPNVPKIALKIALGEAAAIVLGSARVVPRRFAAAGFIWRHQTVQTAIAAEYAKLQDRRADRLARRQWVKAPREIVWQFFADEKNLERLTPESLKFHVASTSTPELADGTTIDYRLSLHGVPFKWRSLIADWRPGVEFVDTQLSGPYKYWHHRHGFEDLGGGTLITDQVHYRVPLAKAGALAAGFFVGRELQQIFAFRRRQIIEFFK